MELHIDYREHDLIDIFKANPLVQIQVCNLIIGDILIKRDNNILFAIERKSIQDLCASIRDGRFRDQKTRLLESIQDPSKIVYILEGKKQEYGNVKMNTINSAIVNLIFKHHYRVIFTDSHQDTIDNIILLYNKILNNELTVSNDLVDMKLVKKSDKINNNIFINMLSVIPGVSIKVAQIIHNKYPSFNDLLLAYQNNTQEINELLLADIPFTNTRKIGKSISKKIYHAITNK
jgi:crossover junction endonuclease MUS81